MSCDCTPFVSTANSGVNNIATNGTIPLGSVTREYNRCCGDVSCKLDGDSITIKGRLQAFLVIGHVTLEQVDTSSSTPPVLSISLLQNGTTVQGSRVSGSSSGRITFPICSVVRNDAVSSSIITLFNTGPEVNLINCAVTVIPV